MMANKKLRIAWFSHLARSNEAASTVSQYCTDLIVPLMRDEFDIEIFSGLTPGTHCGVPRFNTLNVYQRHRADPFDLFFYQVEDGALGRIVRTQVGMMPGITWMHDTFLSDPGAEGIHTSPWERSVKQMVDPSLAFLKRDDLPLQPQPQGYRETSISPVVLFSSKSEARSLERFTSGRYEYASCGHRAVCLPIPVSLQPDESRSEPNCPLQVVAFGTTRMEGRAHKFLPALADSTGRWELTWVIDPSERVDALRLVSEFGLSDRVTLVEVNSPEGWQSLVAKSDLALHLNASPHGRLSPYIELSMVAGVPTVVMRCARGEELSPDIVFSIVPGLHETAQIVGILNAITRGDARRFGRAGQELVKHENDPTRVALRLGAVFRESAPLLRDVMKDWKRLYDMAERALMDEIKGLTDAPVAQMPGAFETIVAPFVEEIRRSV